MTGQQHPAAAGDDQLRAGDADRERVIETLKTAFVHGRLTKDELDTRAGQALSARTHADLAALTSDISASPAAARPLSPLAPAHRRPPARARRRRPLVRAAAGSGACLAFAFGVILLAANVLDPNGLGNPNAPWSDLCRLVALVSMFAAVCIAANGVSKAVEQRRSRTQLPPGPGPALPGPDSAQRGGAGRGPLPRGPRDGQAPPAELRADEPRQRRRHVPARTAPAARDRRPAQGAV
jgi:Domain of unknown function (DUF1707)